MPYILNIESSTDVCSVALSEQGRVIDLKESWEGKDHARLLGVYVQEIMHKNKIGFNSLSAIAVSEGPGSYTGLRIGVSLAKGLCYANDTPLIAISPLRAMSSYVSENMLNWKLPTGDNLIFCPMTDARRMEVYTAIFDRNNTEIEGVTAKVLDQSSFRDFLDKQPMVFFGNGSAKLQNVLQHPNAFFIPGIKTSARFMCLLSGNALEDKKFENLAYFEPFYLKDFIAGVSKKNNLR